MLDKVLGFIRENPKMSKTIFKHATGISTIEKTVKIASKAGSKAVELHKNGELHTGMEAAALVAAVGVIAAEAVKEVLIDEFFG